jgi:hypothetical protein
MQREGEREVGVVGEPESSDRSVRRDQVTVKFPRSKVTNGNEI